MKTTVVLFIILYKVMWPFKWKLLSSTFFSLWIKSSSVSIQVKATEQYFPVVLFIVLYKVVLTFESVDEILKFEHSNKATEQYFPVVLFITL